MAVRVRREGRTVTIDVRADSFLRGMVRRIVACLLEVGLGRMDDEAVRSALAGPGPALDGASVPAKGLCLRRVAIGARDDSELNGEHEER
jgi:tRNA pseudouridine38-40 synthase